MREWMFMECTGCGNRNYRTQKDPKAANKLELKKYCKFCGGHKVHKEKRK
jgi:large subunit ribosomal protein L33